jgi:membrane associated rhomboid family serine protease
MVTETTTTENRCYRHPDRETFVKCQRCGRPICGQCQTLAPVGVHCPECVREARGSMASNAAPLGRRVGRMLSPGSGRPIVTYSIIAICIVVFILEIVTGLNPLTGGGKSSVEFWLAYFPHDIIHDPWSIITVNFVHESVLHIAFNMYSLFVVGIPLERYLGRVRFLALFFISGIGAVVAVDFLLNAEVVGASGAIFGILGALVVFARRMGLRTTQLYIVIVINLAIGFVVPNIAWQAHVGGLIVGVGLGFLMLRTAGIRRRVAQIAGTAGVAVVLLLALLANALA